MILKPLIPTQQTQTLTPKSVESPSLPLESIDHIHGGDSLPPGVLGVGNSITDDVLQEDLEDAPGLLVYEAADTLDATTTCETANGGLGDALDVVAEDLPVPLGSALAQPLSSLSSA